MEVMKKEIKRSQRTGRTLVLPLFNLDRLKQINDRYGHVVGTRALVRLAEVLRGRCRDIDTPARIGGDEFAVVLLETENTAGRQIADPLAERLWAGREDPRLSVGMGM